MPRGSRDWGEESTPGVGGDPKVILLVSFVDWAKKIFVTNGGTDRQTLLSSIPGVGG